jgi:hypothetical protein
MATAIKNAVQHILTNGHGTNGSAKRPIKIAGCSGGKSRSLSESGEIILITILSLGVYDRKRAIHDMAKDEDVDVITGDWMSEANMTLRGSDKRDKMSSGTLVGKAFEPYFLEELDPAIPWLAKRGVKVAVNAGASDVQGLAEAVKLLIKKHGVDLKVGYVDGDDVTDAVLDLYKKGNNPPRVREIFADRVQARSSPVFQLVKVFKNGDMTLSALNVILVAPVSLRLSKVALISLFAAESQMPQSLSELLCGGMVGNEKLISKNSLEP